MPRPIRRSRLRGGGAAARPPRRLSDEPTVADVDDDSFTRNVRDKISSKSLVHNSVMDDIGNRAVDSTQAKVKLEELLKSKDLSDFQCYICLETTQNASTCCLDTHISCYGCLQQWLRTHNRCPACGRYANLPIKEQPLASSRLDFLQGGKSAIEIHLLRMERTKQRQKKVQDRPTRQERAMQGLVESEIGVGFNRRVFRMLMICHAWQLLLIFFLFVPKQRPGGWIVWDQKNQFDGYEFVCLNMIVSGSLGLLSAILGLLFECGKRAEDSGVTMICRLYIGTLIPILVSSLVFPFKIVNVSLLTGELGQWEKFFVIQYMVWILVYYRGVSDLLITRDDPHIRRIDKKVACLLLFMMQCTLFYSEDYYFSATLMVGPLILNFVACRVLSSETVHGIGMALFHFWGALDTFWL